MHKIQTGILLLLAINTTHINAMKRLLDEKVCDQESTSSWHILNSDALAKIAAICNSDSRNQLMKVSKELNYLVSIKNIQILHNNPLNIGKKDTIYYLLTSVQKNDIALIENLLTNNINPTVLDSFLTAKLSFTKPLTPILVQETLNKYHIETIALDTISSHYILAVYEDSKTPSSCFLAVYNDEDIKQHYPSSKIDHSDWLLIATYNKYKDAIKFLLADDTIQINKKNIDGETALHIAAFEGDTNIVKLLLTHPSINLNEINDRNNLTAFHTAICLGHLEIIKLLLAYDETQLNSVTIHGFKALHSAVFRKKIHCIEYFLTQPNIQVNEQNHGGNTALHLGVINGRIDLIRALLKHPAIEINIANGDGETPLNIAKRKYITADYQEIKTLLLQTNKSS